MDDDENMIDNVDGGANRNNDCADDDIIDNMDDGAGAIPYKVMWGTCLNINKPAAKAAGADPSRWNSTSRQNPLIQQNPRNFLTKTAIQDLESLRKWPFSLFYDWKHHL